MKKKLCYLLVFLGVVLVISNATTTSAYNLSFNIKTKILDAYYTNADSENSTLENDIVIEFLQEIKILPQITFDNDYYSDTDRDDNNDNYRYFYMLKLNLILDILLELPSGLNFSYTLFMPVFVSIGVNKIYATLFMFNHAIETGWYYISIESHLAYSNIVSDDSSIFDPPNGSDDEVPAIKLVY